MVFLVKDEVSRKLTDSARDVLRSFGGIRVDEIGFHHSYALVGFKGAQPGSVAEQHSNSSVFYAHYHLTPELVGGLAANSLFSNGFPFL